MTIIAEAANDTSQDKPGLVQRVARVLFGVSDSREKPAERPSSSDRFWTYTEDNGKADTSPYKGIL